MQTTMKKINKLFVLAIASMAALASCQKAGEIDNNFQPKVLKAVFEDGLSKTALAENFQIQWSESDAITGFDQDGTNHTSTSTAVSENKLEAAFTFKDLTIEDDLLLVMYPADSKASINNTAVISTTLPEVQNAVAGSFDPKANLALADGGVENVKFLNGGALLAFDIKNDNIAKIELESASYENFAGPAYLSFSEGTALLQSTYASDLHKVTLQGNFEKGKTYYAVVFPSEYSSLKMIFTRNDGKTATYTNSNSLSVTRNSITTIWKGTIDDSKWEGGMVTYMLADMDGFADWTTSYAKHTSTFDDGAYVELASANKSTQTITDCPVSKGGDVIFKAPEGKSIVDVTFNCKQWTTKAQTITLHTSDDGETFEATSVTSDKFVLSATGLENVIAVKFTCSNSSNQIGYESIMVNYGEAPAPVTKYDVTCETIEGGTISASPAKAAEGATVTLTATPAAGYEFESWTVTNASTSAAITVSEDNKFTMPAANVNVSATFRSVGIPDKTIAEFIAAKGGECYLTGVVSNIANMTYGNFDLTDASGKIYVYGCLTPGGEAQKFSTLGVEYGDKIKVVASEYELYNGTEEAKNVVFVEIVEKATKYNVNIASGISNGTVTVNPTQAAEGQTVTITAIPASGYKVKSVTVKKTASGTAITVTDNKFTMPAEAVTVSAEFEENGLGSPVYKLETVKSSSNTAYATYYDVTINNIGWKVPGNQNFAGYWRIGGKSLSNTDRYLYSKTAITDNIGTVIIHTNGVSNNSLKINSIKLEVYSTADFAAAGASGDVASLSASALDTNKNVVFTKADSKSWANCFYRIVFNLTNSTTSNYGVDLKSIEFYK